MRRLRKIAASIESVNRLFGRLAYILVGIEAGFVMLAIFLRYILNSPIKAATEIEQILMVFISFLGCSYVLMIRGHVCVDFFMDMLKERTRDLITGISYLTFGIPYCGLVFYFCFWFVESSYIMNEHSQGSMILLWPIKSILLFGFFLLAIQFLISGIEYLHKGTKKQTFIEKKGGND